MNVSKMDTVGTTFHYDRRSTERREVHAYSMVHFEMNGKAQYCFCVENELRRH